MITEKDLNISNISYTNKDFTQIYPESIDLVKQLTNKWDIEHTNESDPGLVLVKLGAFNADKLNYNIDKNVLEDYVLSATQETSARKLYDMLGYNMRYYQAAVSKIYFTYSDFSKDDGDYAFQFNPFETSFQNADGSIIYTLVQPLQVISTTQSNAIVIQGQYNKLKILGEEKIQLYHLDSENRLFFPETMIAENGIIINGIWNGEDNPNAWHKVNNLNIQPKLSKVYKFGYSSEKQLPYIQFPEDISDLIEDGLEIGYIVTLGNSGNASANTITEFAGLTTTITDTKAPEGASVRFDSQSSTYSLYNSGILTEGKDPENLDEAYNSFKKTIGTFETLVTPRDYANYIYNTGLVSNVQVSDRRTDLNYSTRVISWNIDSGTSRFETILKQTDNGTDAITAFDLCVYPFNPIKTYTLNSYNTSFTPLTSSIELEDSIGKAKAICHDFKHLNKDEVVALVNFITLNCKVFTTKKVNKLIQEEIISNIKLALYKTFNARGVDFGEEIPYESIYNTILTADSRIKDIMLDDPILNTKFMREPVREYKDWGTTATGYKFTLSDNKGLTIQDLTLKDFIAYKNLLAGKIPYFTKLDAFDHKYGSANISSELPPVLENIKTIESGFTPAIDGGKTITLRANEVIQLITPSYYNEKTYTYGIYYCCFEGDSQISLAEFANKIGLYKNAVVELPANYKILINYTNSSGNKIKRWLNPGDKIRLDFDPATIDGLGTVELQDEEGHTYSGYMLEAKQNINRVDLRSLEITGKTPLFWILNEDYELIDDEEYLYLFKVTAPESGSIARATTRVLYDNEALIQKLDDGSLRIFGPGTKIECKDGHPEKYYIKKSDIDAWNEKYNTSDDLNVSLQNYANEIPSIYFRDVDLLFIEQSILTLTNKDSFKVSTGATPVSTGIYEFNTQNPEDPDSAITPVFTYTIADSQIEGEKVYITEPNKSYIRTVLDFNLGPDVPQELLANQYFKVYYRTSEEFWESATIFGNDYNPPILYSNFVINTVGNKIYLVITDYSQSEKGEEKYPYTIYSSKNADLSSLPTAVQEQINAGAEDIIIQGSDFTSQLRLPVAVQLTKPWYVTVYISSSNPEAQNKVKIYTDQNNNEVIQKDGLTTLQISNLDNLIIEPVGTFGTEATDYIRLFMPQVSKLTVAGTGQLLGFNDFLPQNNAQLSTNSLIETKDPTSAEALYDYNNIANMFTLSKIDFSTSSIEIAYSSREK